MGLSFDLGLLADFASCLGEADVESAASVKVFVPLLAFDESGSRIGYGKGFYDRFLSKCRPDSVKIGLSFFQSEPKIIHENIDFPLDYCITPKKIYTF